MIQIKYLDGMSETFDAQSWEIKGEFLLLANTVIPIKNVRRWKLEPGDAEIEKSEPTNA